MDNPKLDTQEITVEQVNELVENKIKVKQEEFDKELNSLKDKVSEAEKKAESAEALMRNAVTLGKKEEKDINLMVKNSIIGIAKNIPGKVDNAFNNEGTDADGKYTVPEEWFGQILDKTVEFSSILRNAQIYNMNSKTLALIKTATAPTFSFDSAEGAARAVSNPAFGKVILDRKDGGFIVLMSKQLLEDSAFDLTSYVTMLAAKAYSNAIETAGFVGNVSPAIVGLYGASGTTDTTLADGNTSFADMVYDDIITAIASVPAIDLPFSKWYMHRTIWALIKKMKIDSKSYVLSNEDRTKLMLEGFPVELSDKSYALTDDAAARKFIAFGNLKNMALGIRNGLSVSVSTDATVVDGGTTYNLFQMGLVGLKFDAAFDIKYTFPEAIATIKTATT